jgi:hypothetical protein
MIRSLGGLRKNRTKEYSSQPDFLGNMFLTRKVIQAIYRNMMSSSDDLIKVDLAGWKNQTEKNGKIDSYLTIEIRPSKSQNQRSNDQSNPSSLEHFLQ